MLRLPQGLTDQGSELNGMMVKKRFLEFLQQYQQKDIWAEGAENAAEEWSSVCRILPLPFTITREAANADTNCSGTIVRMQRFAGSLATTRRQELEEPITGMRRLSDPWSALLHPNGGTYAGRSRPKAAMPLAS